MSEWKTSSYSPPVTDVPRCVEVRLGHLVAVRDTKDRRRGMLIVSPRTWTAFLTTLRP